MVIEISLMYSGASLSNSSVDDEDDDDKDDDDDAHDASDFMAPETKFSVKNFCTYD